MLQSQLTTCSGDNISSLLNKIDCKLVKLGTALYGNSVYLMNNTVSAVDMIDLLTYKRILTFRQVNPQYASCGSVYHGEMIGDVIQWNKTNLIHREHYVWWYRIIKDGISNDSTFTDILKAKTMLTTISVVNTTANAFHLTINLTDSTPLLDEDIAASGFLTLTLDIPINLVSGINVTSPSWNGANINLSLTIEDPFTFK